MRVIATVVGYDPVRRNGFLSVAAPPGGRIHFHLRQLPLELKDTVIVASRAWA